MTTRGNAPFDAPDSNRGSSDGSPDPTSDLRRTLNAVASGRASRRDLERAATDLVSHLRREQHAPEQMLLRIKEVLADAGLRPTYASTEDSSLGGDANLYRDVIAWCIRSYYEAPSTQS
jgi:hypothetical protein